MSAIYLVRAHSLCALSIRIIIMEPSQQFDWMLVRLCRSRTPARQALQNGKHKLIRGASDSTSLRLAIIPLIALQPLKSFLINLKQLRAFSETNIHAATPQARQPARNKRLQSQKFRPASKLIRLAAGTGHVRLLKFRQISRLSNMNRFSDRSFQRGFCN